MLERRQRRFRTLAAYVSEVRVEQDEIPGERRVALDRLASFVRERRSAGQTAELVFICTHNSRRSQMAQIWAQTAAHHFGIGRVRCSSGGTVATAFNPRAVASVQRAGLAVEEPAAGSNPIYRVRFVEGSPPMECFSKVYDAPANPQVGFAAVMTCSAADDACPVVRGAAERISLPYDDPGAFDGTSLEQAKYDECCRRIAREMFYAFSLLSR